MEAAKLNYIHTRPLCQWEWSFWTRLFHSFIDGGYKSFLALTTTFFICKEGNWYNHSNTGTMQSLYLQWEEAQIFDSCPEPFLFHRPIRSSKFFQQDHPSMNLIFSKYNRHLFEASCLQYPQNNFQPSLGTLYWLIRNSCKNYFLLQGTMRIIWSTITTACLKVNTRQEILEHL